MNFWYNPLSPSNRRRNRQPKKLRTTWRNSPQSQRKKSNRQNILENRQGKRNKEKLQQVNNWIECGSRREVLPHPPPPRPVELCRSQPSVILLHCPAFWGGSSSDHPGLDVGVVGTKNENRYWLSITTWPRKRSAALPAIGRAQLFEAIKAATTPSISSTHLCIDRSTADQVRRLRFLEKSA